MFIYKLKILLGSMFLLVVCLSCDNNTGKSQPPAKVYMYQKYTDLGAIEHGVDAVPDKDGINIEWILLPDPDIKSYKIYRKAQNESIFSHLTTIPVENVISPFDTLYSYVDDRNLKLDNNQYYYYYVKAVNKDGVEGTNSDTVKYMLFSKPFTENVSDISVNEQPNFFWHYQGGYIPNFYIVRIEDVILETLVWTRRLLNQGFGPDQEIDLSTVNDPPVFQSGSLYRWRIDVVGPDSLYSGSESEWKSFSVN